MSSDWPVMTLGDVCLKITDGAHNSPKSVASGKPMASVKDLTRFGVDLSDARHISVEDYEALVRQGCRPEVGDVLIAKDGNSALDTVCNVKQPLDAVLLSSVAILRPDPKVVDSDFLKFFLSSRETIDYLKGNFISGAAIPRVVLKDFKKAKIKLPPLDMQKDMAAILNSVEGKIELNRQINQTLEQIAQTIFKSWFVDFEPVKAKIEAKAAGRDPERAAMCAISGKLEPKLDQLPPEQYQQLAATAALFPDELVESELGLIPVGWEYQTASELAEIGIGKTPPRKEPQWFSENPNDIRWVSIRDMGISGVFLQKTSEFLITDAVSRFNVRVVPGNTVLLSFKLTVGRVAITDGEMVTNEAIAHFKLADNSKISFEYLYLYLRSFDYSQLGSTSSIAEAVNSKTIRDMKLLAPDLKCMKIFTGLVKSLFSEIRSKQAESENLAELRDGLLPKLLSGEISLVESSLAVEGTTNA